MWAAPAGIPSFANAGAAIVAVMIYAGIEGSPMPRIIQVIIVKNNVNSRLVEPSAIMVLAIVRPNPVFEQTPMMIPTQAQATATETVCFAPLASASRKPERLMRVSFLNIDTTMVTRIVITAEKITVVPEKNSI